MTTSHLPPAGAGDRTVADRKARFTAHGFVAADEFAADEIDYAKAIGFNSLAARAIDEVEKVPADRQGVDGDKRLTTTGRREVLTELLTTRAAAVRGVFAATVQRVAADLDAAVTARDRAASDPRAGDQIQPVDVIADYGVAGKLDGFRGVDVAGRLDLLRRGVLDMKPDELRETVQAAASNGDSMTMLALDGLPPALHRRVRERAGLDVETWSKLRRRYREARNPEGTRRIAMLALIGERLASNAMAALAAIGRVGSISSDEQAAFDTMLEPLRAAIGRARS